MHLESLDLISHCPQNYSLWINEVEVSFLHKTNIMLLYYTIIHANVIQLRLLTDEQTHCCSYPKLSSENDSTDVTLLYR